MRLGGQRWAISFADICLLLLGFSLIAQVRHTEGAALAEGIRTELGGKPVERRALDPARLFEPGEAVFRAGHAAFGPYTSDDRLTIVSRGTDRSSARFDGWELAAARTAAIARAATAAGAAPDKVAIDMAEAAGERQRVTIVVR